MKNGLILLADRLESQENELSGISGELEQHKKWHNESIATATNTIVELEHQVSALTARAEQAEAREMAAVADIERISENHSTCHMCDILDAMGCCHKSSYCDGLSYFKWRGLPQDGEGK